MASEAQIGAFLAGSDWAGAARTPLAGDASARRYERLAHPKRGPAMLMIADSSGLDRFIAIGKWLRAEGLSAPEVYAADMALGLLLIEDLGDQLFTRLIADTPSREGELLGSATELLADIARRDPPPGLTPLPLDYTDLAATAWDWYALSPAGAEVRVALDATFATLSAPDGVFIHRDFHAGNLLWLPERTRHARIGLIDYQDARTGHVGYDLVSMTRDARRDVPDALHHTLVARFAEVSGLDPAALGRDCATLAVQRNLRILGVFARLARELGKPQYLGFLPQVWRHLMRDLGAPHLGAVKELVLGTLPVPDAAQLARLGR